MRESRWRVVRRGLVALACAGSVSAVCRLARADPQWTVGLIGGGAWGTPFGARGPDAGFFGGVHGDVLLGQQRNTGVAVGPYARVTSLAFEDVRLSGGASVLLPLWSGVPLVLSGGGVWRSGAGGSAAGFEVWGFWGFRSHNFHDDYSLANGLVLGWQRELAGGGSTLVVGAQLDAAVLALPVLLLYEAVRR